MTFELLAQVSTGSTGTSTAHAVVLQILRWAHFFFGIAWIGHLYYFNFVQSHAEKALDGPQKKIVVPNFRGRAIWWFRMGAMVTFLTGLAYILYYGLISGAGASRAILITYLVPTFAVFYGAVLLGEPVTAAAVGGLALVLAGVGLGTGAVRLGRARRIASSET